jgi:molybdopterin/thiamine biosynthesis adenylyltransferase
MITTRWSGAEWADRKNNILIVGAGGIGSWLSFSLSRIDHSIVLIDDDRVDATNVLGGQFFKRVHIDQFKANSVRNICREFGCNSVFQSVPTKFNDESYLPGRFDVVISAVDNMKAREDLFKLFCEKSSKSSQPMLFIDGRLTMEMYEVFAVEGNNPIQIEKYKADHLFPDEEADVLDCTTKQSTFAAMGIASLMTTLICNWNVNMKYELSIREVPFYTRHFLPILEVKTLSIGMPIPEEIVLVGEDIKEPIKE